MRLPSYETHGWIHVALVVVFVVAAYLLIAIRLADLDESWPHDAIDFTVGLIATLLIFNKVVGWWRFGRQEGLSDSN